MNKKTAMPEMTYNKITLSFSDNEEKAFLKKYFTDSLSQFRIAFALLLVLYAGFGYLDYYIVPEHVGVFHTIRYFVVVPLLLAVFLLSFIKIFPRIWQVLLLVSFVVGGAGVSIMNMYSPENYAYYAGMMLIFIAGYFFIKLRFFLASLGGWIIVIIFNIALFYSEASFMTIINNNFFFISANIIGMFAAYNIEFNARRNFFLNQKLDAEQSVIKSLNRNLEQTVKLRTNELLIAKEKAEVNNINMTSILEGTRDSIWAFDRNYKILYINPVFQSEFLNTFGVKLIPGKSLVDALPKKIQSFWKPRYDKVLNGEQFMVEDAVDTGNGLLYIQVNFNPVIKNDKVVGGSCFGSNVTPRKLTEIELVEAKEQAEESDRLKSAFLANMSHEIRTPMNGILGFSSLLQEQDLSEKMRHEYIGIIEESGQRMLNIINDIIDISKIEAGSMKVHLKESNVNEQLDYIHTFFKPKVEAKGITLNYSCTLPREKAVVTTDREKVFAILTNLVNNAMKYTNEGEISFGYEKKGDYLEFYVNDTGIGISSEKQTSVFERFIQADSSKSTTREGAGLGLSITKAYVEMLGGEIWVESNYGKGSTFYFTIPY